MGDRKENRLKGKSGGTANVNIVDISISHSIVLVKPCIGLSGVGSPASDLERHAASLHHFGGRACQGASEELSTQNETRRPGRLRVSRSSLSCGAVVCISSWSLAVRQLQWPHVAGGGSR
jgi:hypothetical protein